MVRPDHLWQPNLPWMVQPDQLWRGTTCGVTDHPWPGGTTYGTVDSPAGPSMAAIDSPAGPPMATKFAVDGPAGPIVGGTIGDVTGPCWYHLVSRYYHILHWLALCVCVCVHRRL